MRLQRGSEYQKSIISKGYGIPMTSEYLTKVLGSFNSLLVTVPFKTGPSDSVLETLFEFRTENGQIRQIQWGSE